MRTWKSRSGRSFEAGIAGDDWFIGKMPQQADSRHSLEKLLHTRGVHESYVSLSMRNERHASHANTRKKTQADRQLEVVDDDAFWAFTTGNQGFRHDLTFNPAQDFSPLKLIWKLFQNTHTHWGLVVAPAKCLPTIAERGQLSRLNLGSFKKIERIEIPTLAPRG